MTMRESDMQDDDIDRLFALAREVQPPLPDTLAARILADAEAAVPRPVTRAAPAEPGGWRGIVAALGGWPALGGLALAGVVGLVIGISPPAGLSTIASGLWGDTLELQLSADADPILLLEG
jgi:hypothetical protein